MKNVTKQRASGILMHISSLPSPYGIGTLGKEAYAFVDMLKDAGFSIWQVLPIGPTSYGDSPYQSFSMYAGNPYFIDLDLLIDEGMLKKDDFTAMTAGQEGMYADYEYLYQTRWKILRIAYKRAYQDISESVQSFVSRSPWLRDFALFSALKDYFKGRAWSEWPDDAIRLREHSAIEHYTQLLQDDIRFFAFVQYLFFQQWYALKDYANRNGITIFGDMPIYVAMDSADAWTRPEAFLLNADRRPDFVAGVPPDYFSQDGQLWGNPLYNWRWHKKQQFGWWTERIRAMLTLYDWVRIDHFIGFAHYYAVPASETTAKHGKWHAAPGYKLFDTLCRELPDMPIVAEDLGAVTPKVKALLKKCGFPGMHVLTFSFDTDENNPHLPHNLSHNTVLYTGTHDNDTTLGWWQKAAEQERRFAAEYLRLSSDDHICTAIIRAAYSSIADTVIIPIQDFLELGSEARMNTPGTVGDNWNWRLLPGQISDAHINNMRQLNITYDRVKARHHDGQHINNSKNTAEAIGSVSG